ncbi:MAG TPA: glycosyltransferase family A protein [Cyclobacteriaceae bacterium]|nr:glycosyltransferase family A protein [Cyclobacteriaceae bacterium]
MNKDLVSVIIPTYGRPKFLPRCIESVCQQSYRNIEIVVVDDNGQGQAQQVETERVVTSIECDLPLTYIVHERNGGGSAARNTGAASAKGEFLCFLDDDDEYYPDRIAKQIEVLKHKNSEDHLIKACTNLVIRRKGGIEVDRQPPKYQDNFLFEVLALKSSLYTGSTLLIYQEAFQTLGGYDERFRRNQDLEFMVRFFERYKITVLNEHLTILNIDDRTNIPTYKKILETKQLFLEKFNPLINSFPKQQQREIYTNNALEIAKVALWNKNIRGFFKAISNANLSFREWVEFAADSFTKALKHIK